MTLRAAAILLAAIGSGCAPDATRVVSLPEVASPAPPTVPVCLPTALDACHDLGLRLLPADPRQAYQFESLACEGGVEAACGELGWMMLHGVWGESNPAAAFDLIDGACEAGLVERCVTLGVLYRARHEEPKAIAVFVHHCDDLDVPSACDELGRMVEDGRGFAKDADAARRLFEHACERGSSAGCGDLGRLLLGEDDARAEALLRGACRDRDGAACFTLGLRARAPSRALAHFERACNLGVAAACASAASQVDPEERAPASLWWLSRACDEADAPSCERLGVRIGSAPLRERARAIGVP